jgi:hypothetical protein
MTETKAKRTVNCPTCEASVAWLEESTFRPFCSERCKLIDFGGWATEKHTIAGEPAFDPEDIDENLQ